eukprot:6175735-Pleurochrysis_carterae.AAC.1
MAPPSFALSGCSFRRVGGANGGAAVRGDGDVHCAAPDRHRRRVCVEARAARRRAGFEDATRRNHAGAHDLTHAHINADVLVNQHAHARTRPCKCT